MGIVFANWDNTSGVEDFELDLGQSNEGGCSAAISTISNFEMTQYGSAEKIPEDEPVSSESEMSEESEMTEESSEEENPPQPAEFLPFEAKTDMTNYGGKW